MVKACVFDVGNTLINDTRLVQDTLKDLTNWLRRKGIIKQKQPFITAYNAINRLDSRPFISHTFSEKELFQRTFEELRIKDVSSKQVLQEYRQFLVNRIKPDNDIIETFEFLRKKGIKVALLTNETAHRVEVFIRKTKLANLLDAVVISEQVRIEKPNPAIFSEISKALEVKCEETIMFGDNEIADGAAKQLGMKFVLVTAYKNPGWQWESGSTIKPDCVIREVKKEEIEKCLETLANGL